MSTRNKTDDDVPPELRKKLSDELLKDLPGFMDRLFGIGQWTYDKTEDIYIAADPNYKGPGFGFFAVRPNGTWFKGVRPSRVLQ